MNGNHLPPEDDFLEWLHCREDSEQPGRDEPWTFEIIAEPSCYSPTIKEHLQDILREMWQSALPVLGELLQGLSRIIRPTGGFKLLLMLLTVVMIFRLAYPLFFFEPPSVIRLLDAEVPIVPWNAPFVDLASEYSERAGLPKASVATLNEFGHYLGRDSYEDFDLLEAEHCIDRVITEEPDIPFFYLLRAEFLRVRLNDCGRAVMDYTTAVELDDTLSMAFLGRGFCYLQNGRFQSAVRDLSVAIQVDQDPRAYMLRGVTYEHLGLYHSAISDYTLAIEQDESDLVLYRDWTEALFFRRGYAYLASEQWDECVADFNRSMEVSWHMELYGIAGQNAHLNRAYCLVELGRYEEAIADYRDILEYWGNDMGEERVQWVEQRIASLELTIEEQEQGQH
jgi:tetratricopeptide (TPR) repeat protein